MSKKTALSGMNPRSAQPEPSTFAQAAAKVPTKRLNAEVDALKYKKLKRWCFENNTTITDWVNSQIDQLPDK